MPRTMVIRPVLNGFVVEVGCQTLVVKNIGELSGEIARYYSNPHQTEMEYIKNAVNKTLVDTADTLRPRPLRSDMSESTKCPEPINQECVAQTEPRGPSRY